MVDMSCGGFTKSGASCRAKAGSSGYCSMHDPTRVAEREKERREQEAAQQTAQARYKPLQEVITVIEATCKAKGWKTSLQHFDRETGRHASLNVQRSFYQENSHGYQTVTGILEITHNGGDNLNSTLQSTSFHSYGIRDLMRAINFDLERTILWLGKRPGKVTQTTSSDILRNLELLLRRFHRVAHQLTFRHDNRQTLVIKDEYDVQDLLHALLLTLFDDVRPEDPAPNHAGKASRLDFFLKKEKIMVEVKMTREGLRDAKVGEELIVDIERYRARADCQMLIFFVYDPGHYLKNPKSLEDDLSRKGDQLSVKVIVYSP